MAHEQALSCLAETVGAAVRDDAVTAGTAALARNLFPQAATLRVALLTADSSVLACVGSLMAPGPLALALLPVGASAAGAAVLGRGAVHLTEEDRRGLACYDFEGTSLLGQPILHAGTAEGPCLGALLLSFQSPAHADAAHARSLALLAAALVPAGLGAAAAPLLQHCALILGFDQGLVATAGGGLANAAPLAAGAGTSGQAAGEGEEGSSSDGSSGTELMLTDIEEEGWEEAAPGGEPTAAAQQGEEGGEQQDVAAVAGWAAGGCRDDGAEPPEDPGSSAAALVVQPRGSSEESHRALYSEGPASSAAAGEHRVAAPGMGGGASPAAAAAAASGAAGGSHWQQRWRQEEEEEEEEKGTQPQQQTAAVPDSPSASKAWAKAQMRAQAAAAASSPSPPSSAGFATASSLGSEGGEAVLRKLSPAAELEAAAAAGALTERQALALAGASPARLLRFADADLERRFVHWHYSQLWKMDVLSSALSLALQLAVLCLAGAGGQGFWLALKLAVAAVPLLFMLVAQPVYVRHREGIMLLLYLACMGQGPAAAAPAGAAALHATCPASLAAQLAAAATSPALLAIASQMCTLAVRLQGRLCVQAPLQALLFASNMAVLLAGCRSGLGLGGAVPLLQGFGLTVVAPLLVLHRLEARARHAFLARLPLLQELQAALA